MDGTRWRVPALAAALMVAGSAYAQTDFPNRRIHMIVPYPAGGIVDLVTRIVTDRLSAFWRQPIIVEAKPGKLLRHRVVLTFEAEAEDVDSDDVVTKVLGALRVP